MERVNTFSLKRKFATLLEKLVLGCSLNYEVIEDKIISNDYFNFLENNQISDFMNKTYSSIIKELFNMEVIFDEDSKYSPIFWAGMEYMNLALDYLIPLSTLFLLCPIKDMVGYYKIYHEMNDIQFINHFFENEYNYSILNSLKKRRGISLVELSRMTGIKLSTLRYLCKNDYLYKTTFYNINLITKALNANQSIFKKNIDINYLPINLLDDKLFYKTFIEELNKFMDKKIDTNVIRNDEKQNALYHSSDLFLDINEMYIKRALIKTIKKYYAPTNDK